MLLSTISAIYRAISNLWKNSYIFRDSIIIATIVLALSAFSFAFDLFDVFDRFVHLNEHWKVDGFVLTLLFSLMGIIAFSYRRWTDLKKEMSIRMRVEKALRINEARLSSLMETTSDWIWEFDKEGIFRYISPRIENILGFTSDEVIGKTPFDLMTLDDADRLLGPVTAMIQSQTPVKNFESNCLHKDGQKIILETNAVPIYDDIGNFDGYRGTNRDITDRKRVEVELQKANDEMEQRVKERTAELKFLNKKLTQKVAELDEFTYIASHDLHEPLRKIIAFSDLLRTDLACDLTPDAETDLKYILDAGRRMQMLIDHLLILSRTGRKAMKRDMIGLSDCARDAVEALGAKISRMNVRLVFDELPVVYGDRTVLTQLYQNLIANAIKFNSGEQPIIHLTAEKVDGRLILGVKDNGIGLKPEFAKKIFTPFQRLHSREQYEGTGIGLAICRKAVERHGGEIWVESEPGQGAHFKFTLGENKQDINKEKICRHSTEKQPSSSSPKTIPATAN